MSKDKEPMRSRRQWREQSAQSSGTAGNPPVPGRPAPKTAAAVPPADTETGAVDAAGTAPAAELANGAGEPTTPLRERESQTRARDRAALRAYKDLVDPVGLSPLPSRRALRQAQLDAERAPITAVNMVVSAAAAPSAGGTQPSPQAKPARTSQKPAQAAPAAPAKAAPKPAEGHKEGRTGQQEAQPAAPVGRPANGPLPRTRVGRRAAANAPVDGPAALQGDSARNSAAPAAPPAPPTSPRSAAAQSLTGQPSAGPVPAPDQAAAIARGGSYSSLPGLVPGGSYYPVSAGPPTASGPGAAPTSEEIQVLSAQKAEAERAAILTQRAQTRDRLAQESVKNRRPAADPTATDNLAMVTPLEFVEVPGAVRPVMRPPTTTHLPIVARSTPQQPTGARKPLPRQDSNAIESWDVVPAGKAGAGGTTSADGKSGGDVGTAAQPQPDPATEAMPAVPRANTVRSVSAERFDAALAARAVHRPGPGNRTLTGGRSSTLRQAEAMATGGHPTVRPAATRAAAAPAARTEVPAARAAVAPAAVPAEVQRSQMPPLPADYAHGLEPLDAMTAGLGRTQRNRLLQWGSLIVGGAAFVVGAIMFITTLTR